MRNVVLLLSVLGAAMMVSCASSVPDDERFVGLANQFIEKYLKMNPENATALGDHRFDHLLNDYSLAGVQDQLTFNKTFLKELNRIKPENLSTTNRVDYHILHNRMEQTIFRLEELKEHEWNPLTYNIGGAIYSLIARDFAPIDQRMASVTQRLKLVRVVTALAKANLKNAPKVHVETAILQNEGTISLIKDGLQPFVDQVPEMAAETNAAREQAVSALEYYGAWLEKDLLPIADADFRLGAEKYRKKLHYSLQSDFEPEQILERAESDLVVTQAAMFETALPLFEKYFPGEKDGAAAMDRKQVIKVVLDRLAESTPTNETIVDLANDCLARCIEFTETNNLVTVPDEPIDLIVMPEFQRGVAVAYCDAPGPLEPGAKTFYAISPTPEDWTKERVESFFREYNNYMLHDLTVHEAVPGHYLQLAHSNRFKAPTMVRSIFYSGPFVEGWATYSEQVMAEKGFGGPEVRMQQMKMRLRLIINAIIDQKIHSAGMTEEEAIALMTDEGFQEEGEATGKWRRACMTSTQLSTYYVGNMEVNEIRRRYEEKHGPQTEMKAMHDAMLSFGSPPPKYVRELLGL